MYSFSKSVCLSALVLFCSLSFTNSWQCHAGDDVSVSERPWLNPDMPIAERVRLLLKALKREEKISLIYWFQPAIPRLGIQKFDHGNDATHGVRRPDMATVFPQTIGLAASFNPEGVRQMADAIADEFRAKHNFYNGVPPGNYAGCLVAWSPTINLSRDPRWGRVQETYGEDPFLTSRMGVAYVRGLQGDNPHYLKVVACIKHFAGNNEEHNRFGCNANADERYWFEYEFKPFEACIKEAGAVHVMSAYNAINGVPCSANKWLLTDILRGRWGFDGYVTSDCGAISNMVDQHQYVKTPEEAIAAALNAGCDLEGGWFCKYPDLTNKYLAKALDAGLTTETVLDQALARILTVRFKLGMFDPPEKVPFSKISTDIVACEKHLELTRQLARESMVLLRNQPVSGEPLLPVQSRKVKSIVVFGPRAADCQLGDYSPEKPAGPLVSPLAGIMERAKKDGIRVTHIGADEQLTPVPSCNLLSSDGKPGLDAVYFQGNNFDTQLLSRIDPKIDFTWGGMIETPVPGMKPENFSVRWTGSLVANRDGEYAVGIETDDGGKLWLDDKLLVNQWTVQGPTQCSTTLHLAAGQKVKLRFEYFQGGSGAVAKLLWAPPAHDRNTDSVKNADLVIAVLGLRTEDAMEAKDLNSLELPNDQQALIEKTVSANPNTVAVMIGCHPLAINWMAEHVPAILNAWFPGTQGGNAIADVLFGDYNPAGRLPLTVYRSVDQLRPLNEYDIIKGRTYMYLKDKPLYSFGHGLSYTSFNYGNLTLSKSTVATSGNVTVSVDVTNTGPRDGEEVVQCYVHSRNSSVPMPIRQLWAFQRVKLQKGQTRRVQMTLNTENFGHWEKARQAFVVEPGDFDIMVGTSSADIRQKAVLTIKGM